MYRRTLSFVHPICNGLCLLTPNSHFVPPPPRQPCLLSVYDVIIGSAHRHWLPLLSQASLVMMKDKKMVSSKH